MDNQAYLWIGFNLFVLAMLALDLGVFHRRSHVVSVREAMIWSAVWISLALLFNLGIYYYRGTEPALQFLTGYIVEKSLSVDNIFIFLVIFSYFRVPAQYQHKVLFWGILSALIMRAILIFLGVALIKTFHWVIFVFGAFLIYTGIRLAFQKHDDIDLEANPAIRILKRFMPVTRDYHGDRFVVKIEGRTWATPLLVTLLVVEVTDLLFALDSIPAILAITPDPFIVYTSNVFAILGLRSLFFALAGMMERFHYLKSGLSAVLIFVGVKMLISDWYKIPVAVSLGVIATILTIAIVASLLRPLPEEVHPPALGEDSTEEPPREASSPDRAGEFPS
ncbi:MAG: TerC family protein [Armatimonadota bacterium]